MNRFEIRRLRSGSLVLLLQHGALDQLDTTVVAPLVKSPKLLPMARLRPIIRIDEVDYVLMMDRLAAVERSAIGTLVADARDRQDDINLALDLLFKGF